MANKQVTKDFVTKLMAAVTAAKDGVGFDDMDEGMAVAMSLKGLIGEFKADKVGTGLMLVSDLTEVIHDERAN